MPVDTAAGLTDAIRRCRLLAPAQLDELDRLQASFPAPRALAGELIRRAWLTPYQVNKLLQDRGRDLLLGSYVLLERLGEGGMGEVFKARNWKLGQVVALKLIRKVRLDNPDAVRRFQREIRAAAQLDHLHIVRAIDADEVGGAHLLVMEYVQGTDLSKLVKKDGPLAVDKACDYCRQAALGLQHACERGLVHRDIKPHNLLLTPGGVVKILDMGLARLDQRADDDASSTMTREGAVMGTLDYMAPEQAMDSHDVDSRADLYSLGCTLYFLLTGKVPFPGGEALQKLLKHRLDEPVPVEQLRPDVPPGVAAVVRKLMAKRPEDRYRTPAEAAAALAFAADQEGRTDAEEASVSATQVVTGALGAPADVPAGWSSVADARSTDQPAAAPRSRRRRAPGRPWVWLGAAIGVVVLGLGLAGLFRLLPRGPNPSPPDAPTSGARPVAPLAAPAEITNSIGMKLELIRPGKFLMGSPKEEEGRRDDEGPQHEVEITKAFYMGACPVTRGQFAAFVTDDGYSTEAEKANEKGTWRNPLLFVGYDQTDNDPVVNVTWNDATRFCQWLSRKEKKTYELPTEAEWEYACRAGTTTAFSFPDPKDVGDYAWYSANSGSHTHPVGGKKPNAWGLYDMQGNVCQWCADGYDKYQEGSIKDPITKEAANYRVLRGGSWRDIPRECHSAGRAVGLPALRSVNDGFRVVLRPAAPAPAARAEPEKEIANSIGMKLKLIQPGAFTMGSPKDEDGRNDNEGPQHEVEITKAFYMGAYPVTKGQFAAFVKDDGYQTEAEKDGKGGVGLNLATAGWENKPDYTWRHPGFSQGDDHPVVVVSWNDATAFCAWLSKKEGKTYELPTEAEWEYACRAGTTTRFWCGDTDASLQGNANIADASLKAKSPGLPGAVAWDDGYAFTSPVGSFKANPWGLYDMGGNVWQWCADGYYKYQEGSIKDPKGKESVIGRILRGGSWGYEPRNCRSADRSSNVPAHRSGSVGFRVVLRPAAPAPAAAAEPEKEIANSIGMKLKLIQPGTFTMGSPKDEEGRRDDEGPQHEVGITRAFYMGACPVTKGQFAAFVQDTGYQTDAEKDGKGGFGLNLATAAWEQKPEYTWRNPGFPQGDDHPVVEVSWNDATAFCAWLSKKEGKTYELPTEAEWEYACRAGTTTRYWCGDADASLQGNANIADASLREKSAKGTVAWNDGYAFTSPVGHFKANPWGLYDMHGNVWQWCADGFDKFQEGSIKDPKGKVGANGRVVRGGSWETVPRYCRSADRNNYTPADRNHGNGFRVVLRPAAPEAKRDEPVDAAADFDKWVQQVSTLSPWKQTGWVAAKLKERNPGFDETVNPTIDNGVVTGLEFVTDKVTDLSPVRALPGLKNLACRGSGPDKGRLSDLAPLKGVLLTSLACDNTRVRDLTPLTGMPLTRLTCNGTRVEDLAPLKGMQLTWLSCEGTSVSDLAPLKGMPLTGLFFHDTRVSDLGPLRGMPLYSLYCNHTPVADLTPLRETPLRHLVCDFNPKRDAEILRSIPTLERINNQPAADFWKAVGDAQPKP